MRNTITIAVCLAAVVAGVGIATQLPEDFRQSLQWDKKGAAGGDGEEGDGEWVPYVNVGMQQEADSDLYPPARMVINLDDPEYVKSLRVSITLKVRGISSKAQLKKLQQEVAGKLPLFKSAITQYFASKKPQELRGGANIANIQTDLRSRLEELLPGHPNVIDKVLFDEFYVQ